MKISADFGGNNLQGLTRRSFLGRAVAWGATAAIAGVAEHSWAAMAPPMPGAKANVPVLTVSNPSCFKILQVTDMHLGEWFVQPPIAALAAMVRNFKPDMIVNTGDCWVNVSRNGWGDTCQRMCRLFDGFKIPWAFAWGNHDESIDYNRAHAALEKSSHALYCGAADGNYRVAVKTKNDKTDRQRFAWRIPEGTNRLVPSGISPNQARNAKPATGLHVLSHSAASIRHHRRARQSLGSNVRAGQS